ncbi:MAG: hypothetical protein ACTSRC_19075 [Candidatus Helarchaeota archaeon]
MEIKTILSPYNVTYPLDQDIFEQSNVLYHGTSSVFCEKIEKRGWVINQQPFDINEIKYIFS